VNHKHKINFGNAPVPYSFIFDGVATKACPDSSDLSPIMPLFPPSISGGLAKLGSAALAAASWQCQQCSHMNSAEKTKRHYFLCQGWRDAIAPSTAGIAIAKEEVGHGQPRLSVATGDVPMLRICGNVTTEDMPVQEIRNDPISRCPNAIILEAPRPRGDTLLLLVGSRHFSDKNDTPNGASPRKGNRPTKRGEKRKSPS
jgi:hypothetical protein